jgi:hypothetical protein
MILGHPFYLVNKPLPTKLVWTRPGRLLTVNYLAGRSW